MYEKFILSANSPYDFSPKIQLLLIQFNTINYRKTVNHRVPLLINCVFKLDDK